MSRSSAFTAHNIELADGRHTLPGAPLLASSSESRALLGLCKTFLDDGAAVADLGCLEGGYATVLARAGYRATGIEVRDDNYDRCVEVERGVALPNLRFVKDDARNIEKHGPFHAVWCCGLLYHLDRPVDALRAIYRSTTRALFLHTHYAREHDWYYDVPFASRRPRLVTVAFNRLGRGRQDYRLSRVVENEGYRGRWFPEFDETADTDAQQKLHWASWGNHRSFWPLKTDLVAALRDIGFKHVFECFDHVDDPKHDAYTARHDRALFVALK